MAYQEPETVAVLDADREISLEVGDIVVRGDFRIEVLGAGEAPGTVDARVEDISKVNGPEDAHLAGNITRFPSLSDLARVPNEGWE